MGTLISRTLKGAANVTKRTLDRDDRLITYMYISTNTGKMYVTHHLLEDFGKKGSGVEAWK